MSYDLYLYPRKDDALTSEAFHAFFDGDVYTHEGDEVHYSNEATGVYFHFAWSDGAGDNPNKRSRPHVSFNMNYFRPHYFALEAEPVLRRLVSHFDMKVSDPQNEGMGDGPYSTEGFLRGWNAGNRFAAGAIAGMQAAGEQIVSRHHTLPTAVNGAAWAWTYHRMELAEDLDDEEIGVYLPPVWFCVEDGQVRTFCLYPNLVPTGVPKVDYVMVLRNEMPRPHKKKSKETPAWVSWEELCEAAEGFTVRDEDDPETLPYLLLFDPDGYVSQETAPRELAKWVIGLPDWPGKPQRLSPDSVLDAELFQSTDET